MRCILFVLFLCLFVKASAQQTNPYGLEIISDFQVYKQSLEADSNNRLVEIRKFIPHIKLDIRYASTNNFTGTAVYDQGRAFARLPVVRALQKVEQELNSMGLGLKIFDAYRPYSVTVKFFEIASDKNFVANPKTGSRHNRGCAIDLTLIHLKNGKELKMPTGYDSFDPAASPDFADLPGRKIKNRDLLRRTMEKYGFSVIYNEWWHYDFNNWKKFSLMDIPFTYL